jgi:hypothetical protein
MFANIGKTRRRKGLSEKFVFAAHLKALVYAHNFNARRCNERGGF